MHMLHSSIDDTCLVALQQKHKSGFNRIGHTRIAGDARTRKALDMAYNTNIRTAPSLLERLVSFKDDLAARYAQYRVFKTTLAELNSLSSRELNDLGLSRSSLRSVAYEAAYKK